MSRGDPTRLFVLSELALHGPIHGHQIRREAQIGRTELWTDVATGSIYAMLARLEREGLAEPVRSERPGRFPERTIYAITAEGQRELAVLRDGLLRALALPSDPFDLAFSVAADVPLPALSDIVHDRMSALKAASAKLEHQRAAAADYLDARDHLLFDHLALRLETELKWHQRVLDALPQLTQQAPLPQESS